MAIKPAMWRTYEDFNPGKRIWGNDIAITAQVKKVFGV
jgi:hypothetical protein